VSPVVRLLPDMKMPKKKHDNPGLVHFKALSRYLELAKDIPEVMEVRLSDDNVVCTVISADPLDNGPRYQVFEAQAVMIQAFEDQPFDFRLLNLQSLKADKRDEHIGGYGDLLWVR
jgi:hypothetical protein